MMMMRNVNMIRICESVEYKLLFAAGMVEQVNNEHADRDQNQNPGGNIQKIYYSYIPLFLYSCSTFHSLTY